MTSHDLSIFQSLIGKPWVSGGRGPDEFDCWGLLVFVYFACLQIRLPSHPNLNAKDISLTTKLSNSIIQGGSWVQIKMPTHLCAVGMSANRLVHHVGLWITDGEAEGVFHSVDGQGAVFQSIASIRQSGMQNFTFYRYIK